MAQTSPPSLGTYCIVLGSLLGAQNQFSKEHPSTRQPRPEHNTGWRFVLPHGNLEGKLLLRSLNTSHKGQSVRCRHDDGIIFAHAFSMFQSHLFRTNFKHAWRQFLYDPCDRHTRHASYTSAVQQQDDYCG